MLGCMPESAAGVSGTAHLGTLADDSSRLPAAPLSDEEFNKRLNEMIKLPEVDPGGGLNTR